MKYAIRTIKRIKKGGVSVLELVADGQLSLDNWT